MPAIVILPEDSTRTVKEVREQYMKDCEKGGLVSPPVPWVKVGNIYLSLFETGEESWPPIVRALAGADKNSTAKFTIMSGRHGAPVQNQGANFQFVGVADKSHIGEDQSRIAAVNKEYKQLSMEVLDVTEKEYNSPLLLKTEIKKQVNGGRTAILAWCFSIFALKTAQGDITNIGSPANLQYYVNYGMKICDLLREDWASMPR
ncbi:hypothetical protein [Aquabacterium sp.]|uniref:hypothetical protein n=1 Tax=Aquabacterium sp. TaxID=1872578 RepID=UPI002C91C628|nr:hypothetical protein [Aquabacterium sp.]HSW06506.1 hypothetical protein [Aquabacterium sp.]